MILHITTRSAWETAQHQGLYRHASLETEGFIHASTPAQVLFPANQLYKGEAGLVLLCLDPSKIEPDVVYEDCYDTGHQFPHIYGPLNIEAVMGVVDFPPNPDGSFSLPPLFTSMYPILEFDNTLPAMIEPTHVLKPIDIAKRCVLCFFQDVITALKEDGQLRQIYKLGSEIGTNPIYEMTVNGERLAVMHPGVGAPLAAAFMDELIALGCRTFIACGGCGVLDKSLALGQVVVPETAVRDEGASYHYLPPSREVSASPDAVAAIVQVLQRHHLHYIIGKTWTCDAIYRETTAKIARRRAEGCLTVEMETATFMAVAQFRHVTFGQILYGGDNLDGDTWDGRNWQQQNATREKLFWLAAEASLHLPSQA